MSKAWSIFWCIFFWCGFVILLATPQETLQISYKFWLLAIWGTIVSLFTFLLAAQSIKHKANKEYETIDSRFPPTGTFESLIQNTDTTNNTATSTNQTFSPENPNSSTPENSVSDISTLTNSLTKTPDTLFLQTALNNTDLWENFIRTTLKNRPFNESVQALEKLLEKVFPNSSGVLYMYNGNQSEMSVILSYGEIADKEIIAPSECASFNRGEIIVTNFANPGLSDGCTHLESKSTGFAFCAPIEGLEEHYGILSVYAPDLSNEEIELWKLNLRQITAIFGLFVADKNLHHLFEEHNIRDTLTELFNRRYMMESLEREIAAATRHKSQIGILMISPDASEEILQKYGSKVKEQLLWEIGQRIPRYIRTEDIPCRYEDDKFCIIMPGAEFAITSDRAERIRKEIEGLEIAYGDIILNTTLSIGVSVFPQFGKNKEELIAGSFCAMQTAKQNGGNRILSVADIRQ